MKSAKYAHAHILKMAESEEKAAKKARLQDASPAVFQSLDDFSQGSEGNRLRYERLVATFEERHGRKPDFLARAPGRVNIIGEHIDYSGYAVLPMAVEQDVAMACGRNDERLLRLSNSLEAYSQHSRSTRESPSVQGHDWYNYFLCGYKGVVDDLGVREPVGVDVVVDGNVPPSAGLSSSSALVCCAALATAFANGVVMPTRQELAELCAKCERFIGTEGGGMDQAISFLGERNKAMLIEFNPIRPSEVRLPSDTVFVISNSLVQANKVAFASYNVRVVECRLASMVVAKTKNLESTRKLLQLQTALGLSLEQMAAVVSSCLHQEAYTRQEICSLLKVTEDELKSEFLNSMTQDLQSFQLQKRALHVFAEAGRVHQFRDTANESHSRGAGKASSAPRDTSSTAGEPTVEKATAVRLGELMDESHASCSELYECSCAELDALVAVCRSSGALGSRLTGAGWGGCAVSLVRSGDLDSFLVGVRAGFYKGRVAGGDELSRALFATCPGPGAALWELTPPTI